MPGLLRPGRPGAATVGAAVGVEGVAWRDCRGRGRDGRRRAAPRSGRRAGAGRRCPSVGVEEAEGAAVELGHPAGDGEPEARAARRRRCRSARRRARGRRARLPRRRRRPRATSRPSPAAPPATRTAVPGGAWRAALSTALTRSWRSRAGSAAPRGRRRRRSSTRRSGRRRRPGRRTPRPARAGPRRGGRGRPRRPRAGRAGAGRRPAGPAAAACSRAAPRWSESAGTTPSARFSSRAVIAVSGVRSSWETVAMRSRRSRSTVARSSAIRLKAAASWPTSSVAVVRTRPV